jgi:hypothetical protein
VKAGLYLRSPFSKDYGEGQVMALVQRLVLDGTCFSDLQRYPMVHSIYPPVYLLLNAAAFVLFGPSLFWPRLISLAAALGVVALLFALLRRRTGNTWIATSFALLFCAPWFVQTWAAMARVDMLALCLSLAGLYAFERLRDRESALRYLPYLLLGLAFYTKQTALLAPAAALGYLLIEPSERRRFPRALLAFALPVAAVMLALAAATRGQAWLHLVPYAAAAEYDLQHMARSYRAFLVHASPLLLVVLAGLLLRPQRLRRGANLVFVLYGVFGLASLAGIAKAGAAQNYFIEPYVTLLLLAAVSLGVLVEGSAALGRLWPIYVLFAAAALAFVDRGANRLPQAIRSPERARDFIALDGAVKATTGPILSENMSVLVTNRKRVWVEPFGLVLLAQRGLWDPARLVGDCRRQMFALVVTETRLREIPGFSECLAEHYQAWQDLGPYQLFRPRPRPGPRGGVAPWRS